MVVFDPSDRILLIRAHDPARRDEPGWWEIPGGGVDPGEDTSETVRRELWEEAGIREATVGPVVWTQTVEFTFAGWSFDQDEWIHVARCDGSTEGPGGLEALEVLAFGEQRWWDVDALVSAGERTIPYRLAEFLPVLLEDLDELLVGNAAPDPLDITPDRDRIALWRAGSSP